MGFSLGTVLGSSSTCFAQAWPLSSATRATVRVAARVCILLEPVFVSRWECFKGC